MHFPTNIEPRMCQSVNNFNINMKRVPHVKKI